MNKNRAGRRFDIRRLFRRSGNATIIVVSLTTITIFLAIPGAINESRTLIAPDADSSLKSGGDSEKFAKPYVALTVIDYVPVKVSLACANEECAKKEKETADIKSDLEESGAATVTEVFQDGPAAEAGIQVGDIITGADGFKVSGSAEFNEILNGYQPGEQVRIFMYREVERPFLERKSVGVSLG